MVRARLVIVGHVQGVWYRGAMQEEARRLRVGGWVMNRPDGAVEAEIEGPRDVLERLIAWAHHGPPAARVTRVTVDWITPRGEGPGAFSVRR